MTYDLRFSGQSTRLLRDFLIRLMEIDLETPDTDDVLQMEKILLRLDEIHQLVMKGDEDELAGMNLSDRAESTKKLQVSGTISRQY